MTKLPRLVEGTYTGPMFMGVVPTQNPIAVEKRRDMNDQPTARMLAFLRAAHDEIERVARAAIEDQPQVLPASGEPAEWTVESDEDDRGHYRRASVFTLDGATVADMADPEANAPTARHIALHDPRAAIARVQAEREVVDLCAGFDEDDPTSGGTVARLTLSALAHGHRHTVPGYDPAWAPEGVSADA